LGERRADSKLSERYVNRFEQAWSIERSRSPIVRSGTRIDSPEKKNDRTANP
jgi:hypothetical protein